MLKIICEKIKQAAKISELNVLRIVVTWKAAKLQNQRKLVKQKRTHNLQLRTLGRSNDGNVFRLKSRTSWPFNVSSTTSTTRSICCTPIILMPSSSFKSRLPWGTHPATTNGLFALLHFEMRVSMADWLGDFTVHLHNANVEMIITYDHQLKLNLIVYHRWQPTVKILKSQ